jgi:hypothetical protein
MFESAVECLPSGVPSGRHHRTTERILPVKVSSDRQTRLRAVSPHAAAFGRLPEQLCGRPYEATLEALPRSGGIELMIWPSLQTKGRGPGG